MFEFELKLYLSIQKLIYYETKHIILIKKTKHQWKQEHATHIPNIDYETQ